MLLALLAVVSFVRWRRRRKALILVMPAEGALEAMIVSPPALVAPVDQAPSDGGVDPTT